MKKQKTDVRKSITRALCGAALLSVASFQVHADSFASGLSDTAFSFGGEFGGGKGRGPHSPPAVPEPEAWLLMLVGVGIVGYSLRGRNKTLRLGDSAAA